MDLTGLHDFLRVDVASRLQHHEQRVVIDLELRPLVSVEGVLGRQLVKVELAPHRVELVRSRLEEAEPHERAVPPTGFGGALQAERSLATPPSLVNGTVDDH